MGKPISLDYRLKPISYEKINSEFTKFRCWVMALGKNRNYSYFSKESVDAALPTLFNVPVVAHLKKKGDDGWFVGSHDKQIVIDDTGITVNDLTLPFGVIPESCNPTYDETIESDGSKATYLAVDMILWTGRYPTLMDAKSQSDPDVYFGESMEICANEYSAYKEDKNYTDITAFNFSALCLLGHDPENPEYHSEPCFPSSRVEPIDYSLGDKFKEEFSLMINEFNNLVLKSEDYILQKKEDENLNERLELVSKYNLKVEDLNFNIEEFTLEELETKLKEIGTPKASFSATYNQRREALRNALDSKYTKDADGNIIESIYYYVMDFTDDFVYVEKDHWSEDGDFEETHGRFAYTFDEVTITATVSGEWEEMFLVWLTAAEKSAIEADKNDFAQIKTDFESYKSSHATENAIVEELTTFKNGVIATERKEAEDEIFSKFEKQLANNEEFKTLKENSNSYELETLSDKCFSILGKITANFSLNAPKKKETIKIPVIPMSSSETPYGGLIEHYTHKTN